MARSHFPSVRQFAPSFIIVLIVWAGFLVYYFHLRGLFPFDDTYITFRYAYNLAHGFGLVWNPGGPHTEGYTNFLYVVLLAPFSLYTKDLVPFAQAVSISSNLITGIGLYELAALLTSVKSGSRTRFASVAVILLYFAEPYTWFNAFSGMETSVFVMLVVLTFLTLAHAINEQLINGSRQSAPGAEGHLKFVKRAFSLAFITMLVRPEGAILGAICLLVFWLRFPALRFPILRSAVLYFALPLTLYAAWKLWYFGDLLPNSYYVKFALRQNSASDSALGSNFLPSFFRGIRYLLVLSAAGILYLRKRPLIILALAIWIFALVAFYWNSDLLQPFYFRFVYSIEVLFLILSALGLYYISKPLRIAGIPWILLAALLWYHIDHTETMRQASMWAHRDSQYDNRWKEVAEIFRAIPGHERMTIAWSDVGILPYFSETKNIDLVGLNTNEIARSKTTEQIKSYLLQARPEFLLMPIDHAITAGDSCRNVVRWGHGLVGKMYPTLLHDTAFASYQPVGFFRHEAYEILILANESVRAAHTDLASRFQQLPYSLPVPTCFD